MTEPRVYRVKVDVVDDISTAQQRLDALADERRLPRGPVVDMHVALDEVLSNALRHGREADRPVRVQVTLGVDETTLWAEVEDDGIPFDPLAASPQRLQGPVAQRVPGGLGLHFVRSLMSEIGYERVAGRNRLVLKRHLPARLARC